MKTCQLLVATCVFMMAIATASSQEVPAQDAASRLRTNLAAGNIQEAGALMEQVEHEQPQLSLELLLLKGALWQERARRVDGSKTIELGKAHDAYSQALGLAPASGAIMNNLALVEAAQGFDNSARMMFERAVASKDERRGIYALNYASYLSDKDPTLARRVAAQAVSAAPENVSARRLLMSLYKAAPRSELVAYLGTEIDAGRTSLALSLALGTAADDINAGSIGSEQLIVLAAAAIASDPVMLAGGPGADALSQLDLLARSGRFTFLAGPLRQALTAPPSSLSQLNAWLTSDSVPLKKFGNRRAVIRALLRGLGEQRMRSNVNASERWLRLALEAGDQGPDPDAFLRLVELLMNTGRRSEVKDLIARYEGELFSEKSMAYQRQDWPLIYKMHLALGTTYAFLGQWENPGRPIQSASFQLENAKKAADRANDVFKRKNQPQALALPAQSAMQLSDFYAKKGDVRSAVTLQLEVSKQLHEAARPNESQQLLASVNSSMLKTMGGQSEAKFRALQIDVDKAAKESAGRLR